MNTINNELALTAMCVWEALISITDNEGNVYSVRQEEIGVCEMRSFALDVLAPAVEVAYKAISKEYHEPFDWEFVPEFLLKAEFLFENGSWSISNDEAIRIGHAVCTDLAASYGLKL